MDHKLAKVEREYEMAKKDLDEAQKKVSAEWDAMTAEEKEAWVRANVPDHGLDG